MPIYFKRAHQLTCFSILCALLIPFLKLSAINHDLGKMGDEENESYIPQTDQWRKEKLGENYMFNTVLPFASVPDRSLFLLQQHDIYYSFNEMLAIKTHDGLYDAGNEKYLKGFMPEQKPRTSLPFILHQADMMATHIEYDQWKYSEVVQDEETKQRVNNIVKAVVKKEEVVVEKKEEKPHTKPNKIHARHMRIPRTKRLHANLARRPQALSCGSRRSGAGSAACAPGGRRWSAS